MEFCAPLSSTKRKTDNQYEDLERVNSMTEAAVDRQANAA